MRKIKCEICGKNRKSSMKNPVKFHRFPLTNFYLREAWTHCCEKRHKNMENARVCSLHFEIEDYIPGSYFKLKEDAVPREFFVSVSETYFLLFFYRK